jgi:acyl-CoA thioester hydrolase
MNVSRYFSACSDGVITLQSELGLTAEDVRSGRRLSFAVVHAESNFFSELRAGDSIWLETTILDIGSKTVTFQHVLYRAPERTKAFATRFKCVLLNLKTRKAAVLPDDVRKKAEAFLNETDDS